MIITITLNPAIDRTMRISQPLVVGKLNRAVSSETEPGGNGINVSRTIKALGGSSIALGFCAGTMGRMMKDMLTAADIHHDFVDIAGQIRVNVQIIDAHGGHTEINEPGSPIEEADFLRLLDRMENYMEKDNVFVLSGSTPPGFSLRNYGKLCKTIKRNGCRLIVDAQGDLLMEALKFEPDYVKPNIYELASAVGGEPTNDPEEVFVSACKLLDMGAKAVCVSMGQDGAVFAAGYEQEALYVDTSPKIYDVGSVGTGDAMVGALADAICRGLKFDDLARHVVATGRATSQLTGTEKPSLTEVYEVYETTRVYII